MKKQKLAFVGDVLTVEYPSIGKTITLDCSTLAPSVYLACDAARHGMKQKLGDVESGKIPMEKYTQALRVVDALKAGEWDLTANRDDTPFVVEAVARVKKVKTERIEKILDEIEDDAAAALVKEWRSNLQVKKAMADIRAERAAQAAETSTEELTIPQLDTLMKHAILQKVGDKLTGK